MSVELLISQPDLHRDSGLGVATFNYLLRQCAFPPPVFRFKGQHVWPAYTSHAVRNAAADPFTVTQSNAPLLQLADVKRFAEIADIPAPTVRRCMVQGCVPPPAYEAAGRLLWVESQIIAATHAIRKAILNRSECPNLLRLPPFHAMITATGNALQLEPHRFALRVYAAGISHFDIQIDTQSSCVYTIRIESQGVIAKDEALRVAFEQLVATNMSNRVVG